VLDDEMVNLLLSEVPSEVFDAIKPLSNRNNQAIFIALLKKEKMRFGQLKNLFKVENSEEINHPLKALVKAGIVSKEAEYVEDIGNTEIAVYCPTFMGKSVMRSLYKGVMLGIDNVPSVYSQKSAVAMSNNRNYLSEYSKFGNKVEPPQINPSGGSPQPAIMKVEASIGV